jgi:CHAD domain-containing protein
MAFDLDRVQKDIRKLRKFLKKKPKHPTPKQIHSLRTRTRRFEASLQALALDNQTNERQVLRALAKLRRRAGKVRDLDVLTEYVANVPEKEESDCLVELLEYLGAEHAQRSKRLHSFAVQYGPSLRRRLKRTAAYLGMPAADGAPTSSALGDAMLSELRLQRELAAPVRLNRKNLHPYRLKVKELRYVLELENNPENRQVIETLGEMKDAIGEWHDWQELLTIAKEQLPHGPECKLVRSFEAIAEQKFNHALSIANNGRKHALSSAAPTENSA